MRPGDPRPPTRSRSPPPSRGKRVTTPVENRTDHDSYKKVSTSGTAVVRRSRFPRQETSTPTSGAPSVKMRGRGWRRGWTTVGFGTHLTVPRTLPAPSGVFRKQTSVPPGHDLCALPRQPLRGLRRLLPPFRVDQSTLDPGAPPGLPSTVTGSVYERDLSTDSSPTPDVSSWWTS